MREYAIAKLLISLASERFRYPESVGKIREIILSLDNETLINVIKNIESFSKEANTGIEKNGTTHCAAGQTKASCEYLLTIIEMENKHYKDNSPTA